jgi:hypothetical protein
VNDLIRFRCSICNKKLRAKPIHVGKRGKCPRGHLVWVPMPFRNDPKSSTAGQDAFVVLPFYTKSDVLLQGGVESLVLGETCYDVRIPPGTRMGQKLRLRGIAGHIEPSLNGGDVHLLICSDTEPVYQIKRDVQIEVPLHAKKMEKGSLEQIVIGQRKVDVKIPPGVHSGLKLRLKGLAEHLNGGHAGDVFLCLTEAQRAAWSFWGLFDGFGHPSRKTIRVRFNLFFCEFEYEWHVKSAHAEVGVSI